MVSWAKGDKLSQVEGEMVLWAKGDMVSQA
jgi:hypothetical protein